MNGSDCEIGLSSYMKTLTFLLLSRACAKIVNRDEEVIKAVGAAFRKYGPLLAVS